MKKRTITIISILGIIGFTGITACNSNNSTEKKAEVKVAQTDELPAVDSAAYKLMVQKCAACHMLSPDPSRKAAMIAPPMIRIKEHYEPSKQTREEFVNAVAAFVLNPSEESVLMPGAVRKFKLMPNLGLSEEEARTIAGAIYDTDFGTMPKMQMEKGGNLSLNNGEKWKLKPESVDAMHRVIERLNSFESENVADFNKLGVEIFDDVKVVLLDQDYKDELVQQLHIFFGGAEDDLHKLQSTKSVEEGKKLVEDLKTKFSEFDTYFEQQ